MKKILTFALLMLVTSTAWAQTADDELNAEIKKNIELQHIQEMLLETMKLQFQNTFKSGTLSPEKTDGIVKELTDVMLPKMEKLLVKVYQENYTLDEIKQMNAYLSTPVGQKSIKLTPMLATAGAKVAEDPEVLEAIQNIVLKYMSN